MARSAREVMPSRVLNDQRGVFGLWMSDFGAAIGVFMGGSWILDGSGYELFSLPASVVVLIILSPIRLTTRRKIIRDFFRRWLSPRTLYDPRKRIST